MVNATKGQYIDHKNGDRLDNRKQNLRICTNQENACNQKLRCNNTTGAKGVWVRKNGKYTASIKHNYNKINLGVFDSLLDAAIAYNTAAIKFHGTFAKLNDISKITTNKGIN